MKLYRLLGKISFLAIWPFLWPVLIFKHHYGESWISDRYDAEWAGAMALQVVWFGILIFGSMLIAIL